MTKPSASTTLLFARNGANRPLHHDRQVLRAEDLTLEQSSQDAMLARARRYLHGWGIVAGFLPEVSVPTGGLPVLTIGPGYGVTPLGDELFLPEPVPLPTVMQTVMRCCGPDPVGCDMIDPEARAAARDERENIIVTAWLIARPASREAAPRPGVPQDCAHPASTLLPSRKCGGMEFGILCELPASHRPSAQACGELMPLVCGVKNAQPAPVPWMAPLAADVNFLVIAQLTVTTAGGITASVASRRTLVPMALLQDWIQSCLCPTLQPPTERPPGRPPDQPPEFPERPPIPPVLPHPPFSPPAVIDPPFGIDPPFPPVILLPPVPPVVVQPPIPPVIVGPMPPVVAHPRVSPVIERPPVIVQPPVQPHVQPPEDVVMPVAPAIAAPAQPVPEPVDLGIAGDLALLRRAASSPGSEAPLGRDAVLALREGLGDAVTEVAGVGRARARALADIAITTEGQFLTAPTSRLAVALNLPEDRITEMKEELNTRHNLGLTFR